MKKYPTTTYQGVSIPLKSLAEQRFESPSLSAINDETLNKICNFFITETYLKCGQSISPNELNDISRLFAEELHVFPYLTIKELKKCFNDGYKERYGKYYGLSIKTFIGWIDYYIQNVRNEDLNKLKPKTNTKSLPMISESEKQKYISSGMKKCLDQYEANGSILEGYSTFMYDVFYDDGFLPTDKDFKNKMYNDAKSFLEIQLNGKKAKNGTEFKEIKQSLIDIEKPKSIKVIAQAQEMIVRKFLRETYREEDLVKELKKKYKLI